MPSMNNVIRKHSSKVMKNPAPSTTKICNCRRKTNCLSECLIYKASVCTILINITMGLVKILSKNVTITIYVLLEINLVKRAVNCPSIK